MSGSKNSSRALAVPTRRVSVQVPPQSPDRPIFRNAVLNRADLPAIDIYGAWWGDIGSFGEGPVRAALYVLRLVTRLFSLGLASIEAAADGDRVTRIRVRLGALSHFSVEHFREHFAGVLSEQRRPAAVADRALGKMDRIGDAGHGARQRMVEPDPHAARLHLRLLRRCSERVNV